MVNQLIQVFEVKGTFRDFRQVDKVADTNVRSRNCKRGYRYLVGLL